MRSVLLLLALVAAPAAAAAQPSSTPLRSGANEVTIGGGVAWGVEVFHSAADHDFAFQTLSWGRVLTAPRGPGALRGRLQWAIEVVPVFGQYAPRGVYGVGVSPILWRWNFEPRGRLLPFAELSGGGLWTTEPVPERTTGSNFTAHLGAGARWMTSDRQGLVLAYRFHHISNGNRIDRNPGVNSHQAYVGWTWLVRPAGER
jgi:opacity protein-like surface antigen